MEKFSLIEEAAHENLVPAVQAHLKRRAATSRRLSPASGDNSMIRPISPQDTPGILSVCESTGLFPPDEMTVLKKLFDDFHGTDEHGHRALLEDEGDIPVGIAYFTPKEMTDRTWELLMIMVHADRQGRGIGTRLLGAVQDELRAVGGRMLLIETASAPELDKARQFYRQRGYTEVAQVPDYYADGVGKVTFTRML